MPTSMKPGVFDGFYPVISWFLAEKKTVTYAYPMWIIWDELLMACMWTISHLLTGA